MFSIVFCHSQEPFGISTEPFVAIKVVISVKTETIIIFSEIFISAFGPHRRAKCQKVQTSRETQTDWQTVNKRGLLHKPTKIVKK